MWDNFFYSIAKVQKCVILVINFICKHVGNAKPAIITFLDLAKPLVGVNHTIQLNKLEKYRIRCKLLDLMETYFSDEQQYNRQKEKYQWGKYTTTECSIRHYFGTTAIYIVC